MPTLFEKLTAEPPKAHITRLTHPSQPFINTRLIAEQVQAEQQLHQQLAALAEDVEGVPQYKTLSQLRLDSMQSNPALQPSARVRSQSELVAMRLDNVNVLLSELSDLQDEVFAAPEKVSLRSLLETLRHVDVELDAAVGRLAGELGLVSVDQQIL